MRIIRKKAICINERRTQSPHYSMNKPVKRTQLNLIVVYACKKHISYLFSAFGSFDMQLTMASVCKFYYGQRRSISINAREYMRFQFYPLCGTFGRTAEKCFSSHFFRDYCLLEKIRSKNRRQSWIALSTISTADFFLNFYFWFRLFSWRRRNTRSTLRFWLIRLFHLHASEIWLLHDFDCINACDLFSFFSLLA